MRQVRPLRTAALVGALALVGAVLMPTAAQAAPVDDVLVFSNGSVVDTVDDGVGEAEYVQISDAITAAGFSVTGFDGGDGQAATWATALSGTDVFVLPEQEIGPFYDPDNPPSWLSAAAMGVLIDWIRAGGTMLVSGTCVAHQASTGYLLSQAVGVDYDDVLGGYDPDAYGCIEAGDSTRWIDDGSLPAVLDYADGNYGMMLASFSDAQLVPLTVWYSSGSCEEMLTVGEFAAGDGRIAFEAWDYFNDSGADQASWNDVLASLIDDNSAESDWQPAAAPPPPVTATTASGQKLFAIGEAESNCDDDDDDVNSFFRVNPGTGDASPIGSDSLYGDVGQGATDPTTGISYVPVDQDDPVLYTVDTASGDFDGVGEFSGDFDEVDEVYSIAIAADGAAYAFAEIYDGDGSFLGLFSLDLSDASLTLIAEIDEDELDDPYAFAYNPVNGKFYAFDRSGHEFFVVNVATGGLTELGELAGASLDDESYVMALQVDTAGIFWVAYDVPIGDDEEDEDWQSMLAKFTLADIGGGDVQAHEVGFLVDDPIYTHSLLLSAAVPELAATGVDTAAVGGLALGAGGVLFLGLCLVAVRRRRRRA
jgi:LPXTG-motif cell wall-anchored protein